MKHYFILTAVSVAFVLPGYAQPGHAPFANRHLSNLISPTSINVHLLPSNTKDINLGSASKNWKNLYLAGSVYKGGDRLLSSDKAGNTFLGVLAGIATTADGNTATGYQAMHKNIAGFHNTVMGYQALFNNTTGIWNDAHGYHALFSNTEGYGNFAFGTEAMEFNTTGAFNSAFGGRALWVNTTGTWNVGNGIGALQYNTEGFNNTGVGGAALNLNSTGTGNTAVGNEAMWTNTTNSLNTAIGNEAGGWSSNYSNLSLDYSNATFLGAHTGSDSGLVNVTAIGFGAHTTASNQVMVGNSSVTSIGGYTNWSNFSDGRYKKNVKEDVPGIAFIKQLRPVTYTLDVDGIESSRKGNVERKRNFNMPGPNGDISIPDAGFKKSENQKSEDVKAKQEKAKVVYTGFIAQEVEQAAKKLNYDFSGVDKPKTEKGFYALRYGDFIVPLVKAVQEQQKQIDELKALVQSITKQAVANTTNSSKAFIKQNAPNPFNKTTVISYYIPENAGNAQIVVTDIKGSLIKTFTVTKGEGQINIKSGELPAATYNYTLFVNGKTIDTRQMIIK